MPRFTKGSKGKEVRFFFSIASVEDEMLAAYCQNPPHPYRTTAEFIRAVLTSYALPLAALQGGVDKERVASLAVEAIYRLRSQAQQIEQKCCFLPHLKPDDATGASSTSTLQEDSPSARKSPVTPPPAVADSGVSGDLVTVGTESALLVPVGAMSPLEVLTIAELDPFTEE